MITSLRGKISKIWGNYAEIEVNGVGYGVYLGLNYLKRHVEGEEVRVFTHMAVSENDVALYGFETWDELQLFKMLITVSGVGPKTAAGIMATCQAIELMKAIGDADVEFFGKVKGVGKKTAQKIIIELKSKIGGLGELNLKQDYPLLEDEVFLSLKQLGFERREIEKVMAKMPKNIEEVGDRLGWCLRNLG